MNVVNRIQNYPASDKVFFSRCQLEAEKYLPLLCSSQSRARKTPAKIAWVKALLIVEPSAAVLDMKYKYFLVIFPITGISMHHKGILECCVLFFALLFFQKMCNIFFYCSLFFKILSQKSILPLSCNVLEKLEQLTWQNKLVVRSQKFTKINCKNLIVYSW